MDRILESTERTHALNWAGCVFAFLGQIGGFVVLNNVWFIMRGMMLMLLIVNIKEDTLSGLALYAQVAYWAVVGISLILNHWGKPMRAGQTA